MIRPYANLHLHSTHSDGKFTPEELVMTAKKEGYKAMAVTDHDTVTANAEVKKICEREGMENIFGAEFSMPSTMGPNSSFHVVGFDFDPELPEMKEYLWQMGKRETDFTEILFERGVQNGTIQGITWKEVTDYNEGVIWLCNEHVFRAMCAKGVCEPKDYDKFWNDNYFHKGRDIKPSYPFKQAPEIIRLIKEAGGIPVLAHPHLQLGYVDRLIELGLEGIEVYHPDLRPDEQIQALKIAYEKGLYIAGGTDHSGICGGEYDSFEHPEETPYYLMPLTFGTFEQHFRELKNRSLKDREPLPEIYFSCRATYEQTI